MIDGQMDRGTDRQSGKYICSPFGERKKERKIRMSAAASWLGSFRVV